MKIVTITHPSGDELPILLDNNGLPIPQPNEFLFGRRSFSVNTLKRNLQELSIFYGWLEKEKINLSSKIKSKTEMFLEAEIRGSLTTYIRKKTTDDQKVVSANTFNQRLTTIRMYLSWLFDIEISLILTADRHFDLIHEHKTRILKWIDSSYMNTPPATTGKKKGLNEDEVQFLITCLDPSNPDAIGKNPLVRYRNYISVLIMLNFGLRPGELLSLRIEDIVLSAISSINVVRRPPDLNDERKPRPKIKRNGRVLPIDVVSLAKAFDDYIVTHREGLEEPAEVESEYLIISNKGKPLSQIRLNKLFVELREKYPDDLPIHLTPKALRHTFSATMERILRKAGLAEDHRAQALAELRGDSSLQSQRVYIAQEIEEQARKALENYQRELLEEDE